MQKIHLLYALHSRAYIDPAVYACLQLYGLYIKSLNEPAVHALYDVACMEPIRSPKYKTTRTLDDLNVTMHKIL